MSAPAQARLGAAALLEYLAARGGQEHRVTVGAGRAGARELGLYHLTVRGEQVQASGPSAQPRLLTRAEFLELFAPYTFGVPEPTGTLTDLGPLFASGLAENTA